MRFPLLLSLLTLVACSGAEEPEVEMSSADLEAGQAAYQKGNCTMCHGGEGQGTTNGPELRGLTAHWNRANLAAFFADPAAVLKEDPRIAEQASNYMMPMPPAANLSEAEREALAGLMLSW